MWLQKNNNQVELKKTSINSLTAVAIDKDKNSQNALKWAIDNLLHRGQPVALIHVKLKSPSHSSSTPLPNNPSKYLSMTEEASLVCKDPDPQTKELFLPFRCFSTRRDIHCKDVVLEDTDVAKALIEYAAQTAIENLVLGASSKGGFLRFKATDVPSTVSKGAPNFCNVYVINKGKIQSTRSALRPAPAVSSLHNELYNECKAQKKRPHIQPAHTIKGKECRTQEKPPQEISSKLYQHETMSEASSEDNAYFRSPFTRQCPKGKSYGEISMPDSDISFVSSGRASVDRLFPLFYDCVDSEKNTTPRMSNSTNADTEFNHSFESMNAGRRSIDINSDYSAFSQDSGRTSTDSHAMENVEDEMRRLKLELKQTMEMYSSACKEALTAKQKAQELQRWKMEEQTRLEEARLAEAAALAIADKERAKSKAAIEAAEAAKRVSELEAQKRVTAEKKAHKETDKWIRETDVAIRSSFMYRKYSIEEIEEATDYFTTSRKIGEGGYGPVYKTHLDHTPVAIKVLRPDAAHGRQQFQQEVEVLSFIRHPNMVLLLGACPEYGCLVYEYLENGSLEDRLFCRGNTKPLSWQTRFKIAAEIGTGLLFLHQTKPEPLVHRDLKPANILLDRNYVSKISDVGLARLVPPSVIDSVTQYRMTSTAGTFCYIDPEYQQTGMLGVKSDVYSLGIMFLQIITARSAMGLTHHVEKAIENGTFAQILDPTVTDWPVEQALTFAKLSLKCGELRKKDRPDLGKVVLPELNKLRAFAEDGTYFPPEAGDSSPKCYSQVSVNLENPPPTSGSPLSRSLASKNPSINY